MPLVPDYLLGPHHVHPGVNTEADYRRQQAETIARGRALYQNLPWRDPWRWTGSLPSVRVAQGAWQIECATGCGNFPSVSPEWGIALCYDCGAVYEDIMIPEAAEIERLLVRRQRLANRNWLPGETVADLARGNAAHGLGADAAEVA